MMFLCMLNIIGKLPKWFHNQLNVDNSTQQKQNNLNLPGVLFVQLIVDFILPKSEKAPYPANPLQNEYYPLDFDAVLDLFIL